MCWCNPSIRMARCRKPGCQPPADLQRIRPRLRWLAMVRCWSCASVGPVGFGEKPAQAYDEWRRQMIQCGLMPQGVER